MVTTATPPRDAWASSPAFIRSVAAFLLLAGLGLAAIRFAGASPADDGVEGALGGLALGAPVAATGVLALLAVRDRAILLLPAAFVLVPMSFLSFALVTLPLLIPSALLFIAHRRRARVERISAGRAVLTLSVVAILLVGAIVALFVHQDPREYTTATGGGSTSDVITAVEAAISLALTAGGVAAGWRLAAPRGDAGVRAGGR